jgi:peptidoglycan/LPS O-acetylase OafA/YrhL
VAVVERSVTLHDDWTPIGYQPSLDGLRAVAVVAVILYHGGMPGMHGGFFGVEVFFVVSGYLITSLLLDERHAHGSVSLRQFWTRRARRLLPAVFTMLLVVSVWAAVWGSAQQQAQLRRDLPWSLAYLANWGQILGGVPYFAQGDPPLLRHLWSLAVEEQWYLVWPLLFVGLMALRRSHRVNGWLLLALSATVIGLTSWAARDPLLSPERINTLYLSSPTRSSGLLLGAGLAFLWRPWAERSGGPRANRRGILDAIALVAMAVLAMAIVRGRVDDRDVYRWMLAVVSISSAVLIACVVHPGSLLGRRVLGTAPMTAIPKAICRQYAAMKHCLRPI